MNQKIWGWVYVTIVGLIWVLASYIVKDLEEDSNNVPPLFVTYVSNSCFVVGYLLEMVLKLILRCIQRPKKTCQLSDHLGDRQGLVGELSSPFKDIPVDQLSHTHIRCVREAGGLSPVQESPVFNDETLQLQQQTISNHSNHQMEDQRSLSKKLALSAAVRFGLVWFMAQLLFNMSLKNTNVSANTIISSLDPVFTHILAVIFLSDSFNSKLVEIALCVIGVALVAVSSSGDDEKTHKLLGDLLALSSALLYSGYSVGLKKMFKDGNGDEQLFFGIVGVAVLVLGAPVVALLAWTRVISLAGLTKQTIGLLIFKGVVDNAITARLLLRAMIILGPTIAAMGLNLQIPLTVVLDLYTGGLSWEHHRWGVLLTVCGACLVIIGLILVGVKDYKGNKNRNQQGEDNGSSIYNFELTTTPSASM